MSYEVILPIRVILRNVSAAAIPSPAILNTERLHDNVYGYVIEKTYVTVF